MIAWPVGSKRMYTDPYIDLGTVYSKKYSTETIAGNLHSLCPFKALVTPTGVKLQNPDDIMYIRLMYDISPIAIARNWQESSTGIQLFCTPRLCNMTNMTIIQGYVKPRLYIPITNRDATRVFVIQAEKSPIIRGEIIDSCLSLVKDNLPLFICLKSSTVNNKDDLSSLSMWYLLSRGIHQSMVHIGGDDIYDCAETVDLIAPNCESVVVGMRSSDMVLSLKEIKYAFPYRCHLQFMCE
jgi:hypothetical protein